MRGRGRVVLSGATRDGLLSHLSELAHRDMVGAHGRHARGWRLSAYSDERG
jgi:hypothetical protein